MSAHQRVVDAAHARTTRLLTSAARYVARHGHYQGQYWPGAADGHPHVWGDPCCAMGAITVAAGITEPGHAAECDRDPTIRQAVMTLAEVITGTDATAMWDVWDAIATWNDAVDRTQHQVVAALRAAADRATTHNTYEQPPHLTRLAGGPSATSNHHAQPSSSTHEHTTSEETTHG